MGSSRNIKLIQRQFHAWFNYNPSAVYLLDLDGRFMKVNVSGQETLEVAEEDLLNSLFDDAVHKTCLSKAKAAFHQACLGQIVTEDLSVMRRKSCVGVRLTYIPVFDQNEQVTAVYVVEVEQVDKKFNRLMAEYQKTKRELLVKEEQFKLITESMSDMISIIDSHGIFQYVSPSHMTLLGYSSLEIDGRAAVSFVHPEDADKIEAEYKACMETKQPGRVQFRCQHSTGYFLTLEATYTPIIEADGKASRVIVACRDITERRRTELDLEESEQRYKSLFDHNSNAVLSIDLQGRLTSVNHSYERMTGFSASELLGQHYFCTVPDDYKERAARTTAEALQGNPQYFETRLQTKSGQMIDIEVVKMPIVVNGKVLGIYMIDKEITEKKRAEEMIRHMAYHDSLTNLPNRMLFRDRLEAALLQLQQQELIAVLFVDLDDFKLVNDTVGHAGGDELLKVVVERLSRCLSSHDTLGRIGGDEFTILLPKVTSLHEVLQVAHRVNDVMKEPYELHAQRFYLTSSIGIAFGPQHGRTSDILMRNADTAMYAAKEKGKNTVQIFDLSLNEKIAKRVELERALRKAVEQQEFTLYYQPLVNAMTQEVYGAEALVRWVMPGNRIISPADFIPVAEETGLIVELGEWVLRQACLQAKAWNRQAKNPLHISVNLSVRQFQDYDFLEKVQGIVQETGVQPEWIGLEITESIIMKDVKYAIQTLTELRKMGFAISVDDFGTGYSSLGYLKTFPIDKLKIDQTFVRDLTTNEEDKAITRTIIALAQNLGLRVIAEGVETEEHVRLLQAENCDELQGYFFSKPIPAQEFELYIRL